MLLLKVNSGSRVYSGLFLIYIKINNLKQKHSWACGVLFVPFIAGDKNIFTFFPFFETFT